MLVSLARYHKCIAWLFMGLIYLELLLVPVASQGATYRPSFAGQQRRAYGMDVSYLGRYGVQQFGWDGVNAPPANAITGTNKDLPAFNKTVSNPATGSLAVASPVSADGTGPGQPEMQAFTSVSSGNMVDLFSGDFSYNIPLMDVGGYPVNLAYRAGISMEDEASWVGLGWNVNPGSVTRNLRGLPDDFNGLNDSIRKTMSVKDNKTVGITGGADVELAGFPKNSENQRIDSLKSHTGIRIGKSITVIHNNYRGWGVEHGLNASLSSGKTGMGTFTGGMSITNSSMDGLTVQPSLSWSTNAVKSHGDAYSTLNFSATTTYNTRSGLRATQLGMGTTRGKDADKNGKGGGNYGSSLNAVISHNVPSYTPTITMPYTNRMTSFKAKLGTEQKILYTDFYLSGYISRQYIDSADKVQELPAYGYLHYTTGAQNKASLLDYNREKDMPYREKPPGRTIGMPVYTYDAFSITGEGTGGMFRAYRGDVGFVHDHYMRTRDQSTRIDAEVGIGDAFHAGIDLSLNRAITETGPWLDGNLLKESIKFRRDSLRFQSVYFRNPGEKSINDKNYYEALGGDDVVTTELYQESDNNGKFITATNALRRFKGGRYAGLSLLNPRNAVKQERDKRTQVITYLTAQEAQQVGLDKYIKYHQFNQFDSVSCDEPVMEVLEKTGTGLKGEYFPHKNFKRVPTIRLDTTIDFNWKKDNPRNIELDPANKPALKGFPKDEYTIRWTGRLRAPQTGGFKIYTVNDDGGRIWINDTSVADNWIEGPKNEAIAYLQLEAGKLYNIKIEYLELGGNANVQLRWSYKLGGTTIDQVIPKAFLYPPATKDTTVHNYIVREERVNKFRKGNHISEVSVLNNDGRRYVYGIPVYNLKQKEVTFAVDKTKGNLETGLVQYEHGKDNTVKNNQGKDNYFDQEETPAYAHSFLLTGILSADYSDITGNGISEDDIGDAVKFNYTKVAGIGNPYGWRTPAVANAAAYNEGLRHYEKDDKGNYIYGEKELWYLHSIESKTMVAVFVMEDREDLPGYNEQGNKAGGSGAKLLREIRLYSKSDFAAKRTKAKAIKTVHFRYSYKLCRGAYGPGTGKLTLDTLFFTYNGNNRRKENPYIFHYNANNPDYAQKAGDRWGSYKNPLQNPYSTSGKLLANSDYPYSLQDSAAAAANAAAWNLDSIILPSGGSMKVHYESDDYGWVQNKRAMNMFRVVGLGKSPVFANRTQELYYNHRFPETGYDEHRYVFIEVPKKVTSLRQLHDTYLQGFSKLHFRISTEMVKGAGDYEIVPTYADLEADSSYGIVNDRVIWVKLEGLKKDGTPGGDLSPLGMAARQFMRLNLPGKAMPGSETGDEIDLREAINMLFPMANNIQEFFLGIDGAMRNKDFARTIDTTRSFVRLNNPFVKKMGGGHRVKRIVIYDHFDKMTQKAGVNKMAPAMYGQEYSYTNSWVVGRDSVRGSSGVAVWEPGMGGEENPFRIPTEYVERIAPMGPVTLGYTEEPMGESFYPGANVGYSNVRVRTINYKDKKSANGYDETKFFTAYDYPTFVDRSEIDGNTKKRYKPALRNLLRVRATYHMVVSQGFKVELNDMHGKLRSKASYSENDPVRYISYSEQFYKTDSSDAGRRRLANKVTVITPSGVIDTAAVIGKDLELMMDMREQRSITHTNNIPLNTDMFTIPFLPPWFILPTALNLAQREDNIYRSTATVKIIQRYGIVDSAIQVDKGSRISTKDMMYDSETGDVVLTRTQNEFNDPIYNFTYPSHWAYEGMGLAYKNIDAVLANVDIKDGRLVNWQSYMDSLFSNGDELMVAGRRVTVDNPGCNPDSIASFPDYDKIWVVDSSALSGGTRALYFIDRWGKAYNGNKISLRVIRSGRRNILGAVGSLTSLRNPLQKNGNGQYTLVINDSTKVIAASAGEFRQYWRTDDVLRKQKAVSCVADPQPDGFVECVKVGGVNTGYQRIRMVDQNPNSATYHDTSYITQQNCWECSLPATWVAIDSFQCATDSAGNNLGFKWRAEKNTQACSYNFGEIRWQLAQPQNCTDCPKPAKWAFVASADSCQKNVNGINTGFIMRRQQDTASCSATSGNYRWVRDTMNCIKCKLPADWWLLDSTKCEVVNGAYTGKVLRKQINLTQCSDSAGVIVWAVVPGAVCGDCIPNWQAMAGDSCQKVGGLNTGVRLKPYKNMSSCGDSAGLTRWVPYGANCDSCKKNKNWQYVAGDSCQKISGVVTGVRLKKMQNLETCSDSANMTKWVVYGSNCDSCKKAKNWQYANDGPDSCQKISGVVTGVRLRKMRNIESCSDSANMIRWDRYGADCDSCKKNKNWQYANDGPDSCQKVGGVITGVRLRKMRNIESCSDSANMIRWDRYGADCDSCKKSANYQFFRDTCLKDVFGNNIGYKYRILKNVEPCSANYNDTIWRDRQQDCISCKTPPAWKAIGAPVCEQTGGGTLERSAAKSDGASTNMAVPDPTYTGWLTQQYLDTSLCGGGATKWERTYQSSSCSPCPNCTADGFRCINGYCEYGRRRCLSTVSYDVNYYTNYYEYVWSDGSSDGWFTMVESWSCTPGTIYGELSSISPLPSTMAIIESNAPTEWEKISNMAIDATNSGQFVKKTAVPYKPTPQAQTNTNLNNQ
ncbi:PA14 domain-containing protein [Paraflavitalea pollutisoli]|uniref:PA14 domain-containing protein n=1 Tax=Paraflavitalea pollutisoli TaxID=3034143 RepID=UPI0023EE2640|nr:PA14 domain-containing protein [Paraflavitalea sp. H1-2-19X]